MKEKQIDALLENIDLKLNNAKDIIASFEKLPPSEKENQLQNLDQLKQQINADILMFETMLNTSKRKKALADTKDELADRQLNFEADLENLKKAHFKLDDKPAPEAIQSNNAVLIDLGDQIGEEAIEKGEEVIQKLKKANQMLLDIEDEIYEQRLKLLRIKDNINSSQSLMNRGKEVVDYFAKAMARDKFIRIAVGFMALLLIGIFVLMYLLNTSQKKMKNENELKDLKGYEAHGIIMENGNIKVDPNVAKERADYLLIMEEKVLSQAKTERDKRNNAANTSEGGDKQDADGDKGKATDKTVGAAEGGKSYSDADKAVVDIGIDKPKKMKMTRELKQLNWMFRSIAKNNGRGRTRHHSLY